MMMCVCYFYWDRNFNKLCTGKNESAQFQAALRMEGSSLNHSATMVVIICLVRHAVVAAAAVGTSPSTHDSVLTGSDDTIFTEEQCGESFVRHFFTDERL